MVRIIELTEDELVLPKVLNPGESSNIDGIRNPDADTSKTLDDIHTNHKTVKDLETKMYMTHKWTNDFGRVRKTPEEIEDEKKRHSTAKSAIATQSLTFVSEIKNAIPFIEKNCSDYLPKLHNSGFLYRGFGINDLPHAVFYGYPRADRKARDSVPELQILFDKALERLGVKALRSKSLFCTGDEPGAAGYGLPFIIIPCNDATFAWSRNYNDIILDQYNSPKFDEYARQLKIGGISFTEFVGKFQELFDIRTVDLDDAIKSGHEIWIKGHYVAVLATLEPQLRKLLFG